jgi:hypothetical protein
MNRWDYHQRSQLPGVPRTRGQAGARCRSRDWTRNWRPRRRRRPRSRMTSGPLVPFVRRRRKMSPRRQYPQGTGAPADRRGVTPWAAPRHRFAQTGGSRIGDLCSPTAAAGFFGASVGGTGSVAACAAGVLMSIPTPLLGSLRVPCWQRPANSVTPRVSASNRCCCIRYPHDRR